jgi:glycosyltransferase involved in cell wall biosynthesis
MSTIEPLVSVIMPTYNTIKYIQQAIDSVLQQSYTNLELIIVNDGSTDKTHELIHAQSDKRIKYFELEKNRGRGYARNYAISKCLGEYIAVSDADDISLPQRLKLQVEFLEQNKDIDILGAQLLHFSDNATPKKIYHFPLSAEAISRHYNKGIMGVPHASCMLRKKCFDLFKYEDNISYNVEDFELFIRLNQSFRMANLPESLVLYRNDLSVVTFTRIRYHDLYHNYSIYLANAKLNNHVYQSFDEWSTAYKKTLKHKFNSTLIYSKIKIREWLRGRKQNS